MQPIHQMQSDTPRTSEQASIFTPGSDEKKGPDSRAKIKKKSISNTIVSKQDQSSVEEAGTSTLPSFELQKCGISDKKESPAESEKFKSTPICNTSLQAPLEVLDAPKKPVCRVVTSSSLKVVPFSLKTSDESSSLYDTPDKKVLDTETPIWDKPVSSREKTPTVVLSTVLPFVEKPLNITVEPTINTEQSIDQHSEVDEREYSPSEILGTPATTRVEIDRLEPPSAAVGTPTASTGPLISYSEDSKAAGYQALSTAMILPGHEHIIPMSVALAAQGIGITKEEIRVARLREVRFKIPRSGEYDLNFPKNFAVIFYDSTGEDYSFAQNYWNMCIEMLADEWCTFEIFELYLRPWTYKLPGLKDPSSQDISEIYTEIFKNKIRIHPPKMFKLFWICLLEHEVSLTNVLGESCYMDLIGHLAFRSAVVYCFPVCARMIWSDLDEEDVRLEANDWEYIFSTLFNNFTIPASELLLTIRFICREIAEDVEMFSNPVEPVKVEDALQYVTWNTEILFEIAYSLPHYEFTVFYPQIKEFIGSFMDLYNCTNEVEERVQFALNQGVNMRNFREKKKRNSYFYLLFPVVGQLKEWDPSIVNLIISFI